MIDTFLPSPLAEIVKSYAIDVVIILKDDNLYFYDGVKYFGVSHVDTPYPPKKLILGDSISYVTEFSSIYKLINGKLNLLPILNQEIEHPSVSVIKSTYYLTGGLSRHDLAVNNAFILKQRWIPITPMNNRRSYHLSIVLNDRLYVIGAEYPTSSSNSAEYYDSTTNKWTQIASCLHPWNSKTSSVVVCLGKIYLLAGRMPNGEPSYQVECYDPKINIWIDCEPLMTDRRDFTAYSFKDFIYIVGGTEHTDRGHSTNCRRIDRYDPLKNEWKLKQGSFGYNKGFSIGTW